MDDIMKILIGYDGSECAVATIDDLGRAGLPRKAEVRVISLAETWLAPPPSSYEFVESVQKGHAGCEKVSYSRSTQVADAQEMSTQAAKRIQRSFPEWDVQPEGRLGSPATELLAIADEWEPDLIAVGSHSRSLIGRLLLGSVSHKVVTEARCSVRITHRQSERRGTGIRIVVGVDGSLGSMRAVQVAANRAWPEGSEVRLITVYDIVTPTMTGTFIPPVVHWAAEENLATVENAQKMIKFIEQQFRSAGLVVSSMIKPGAPRRVLVDESQAWDADCIFVGARGLSRIDRFLLGSVSAAVAARAHCSVEIVRTKVTTNPAGESR